MTTTRIKLIRRFVKDEDQGSSMIPITTVQSTEAELKEFEQRPRLKYGWFHLKSCSMFQDLSRRLIETGFFGI